MSLQTETLDERDSFRETVTQSRPSLGDGKLPVAEHTATQRRPPLWRNNRHRWRFIRLADLTAKAAHAVK
jgi:hypothetical protein